MQPIAPEKLGLAAVPLRLAKTGLLSRLSPEIQIPPPLSPADYYISVGCGNISTAYDSSMAEEQVNERGKEKKEGSQLQAQQHQVLGLGFATIRCEKNDKKQHGKLNTTRSMLSAQYMKSIDSAPKHILLYMQYLKYNNIS